MAPARVKRLLVEIDALCWREANGAGFWDGVGSGVVTDDLWIHPRKLNVPESTPLPAR